jgi:Cys-rich protein (TIGR01571 family)
MSVPEIVAELGHLRERRCKLRKAARAGYTNAEARLGELEPVIQGHIDMLKTQGTWAMPYMGCDKNPQQSVPVADGAGGNAPALVVSQDAHDVASQLGHPPDQLQPPVQLEQPVTMVISDAEAKSHMVALAANAERHEMANVRAKVFAFAQPGKLKGWARFWVIALSILFELSLVLCCACIYDGVRLRTAFPQEKGNEDPELGFAYSLFGCFNDMRLCLFSCCCLPIRWADTLDKANDEATTISYWPAIVLVLTFWVLNMLVGSAAQHPILAVVVSVLMVVVYTFYRQKLRKRYQLVNGSCYTFTEDFFAWLCCPCCAAVQDARHVEASLQSKIPMPGATIGFGPEPEKPMSARRSTDDGY